MQLKDIAGFLFNIGAYVAMNVVGYTAGVDGRIIILHLAGPVEHHFTNERADQAYVWYLQLTGQARIAQ